MYVISVDTIVSALVAKEVTLDAAIELTFDFPRLSRVREWLTHCKLMYRIPTHADIPDDIRKHEVDVNYEPFCIYK